MADRAWIDATRGASGDMLLAALLDAGADLAAINDAVGRLDIETVVITLEDVRRHGLRACRAIVDAPPSTVPRRLDDVLAIIMTAHLPAAAERLAQMCFRALAEAEAKVHGIGVAQVHFHEVGALDAIADVVACASALHHLGLLEPHARVRVSAIALGSGSARTAHGTIPVPVPAVVELLARAGAPVHAGGAEMELCTPTAAAILTSIAADWGSCPPMALRASGVGGGAADPPGHLNVTRILLGDATDRLDLPAATDLVMLESTIDDLEPRLLPGVLDGISRAGALDVWATAATMRKGRVGQTVSALVAPPDVDPVIEAFVTHSPTLGVRRHPVERIALRRDHVVVSVDGFDIGIKRGWLGGRIVTTQPEFADIARAAAALGVPERAILARAIQESAPTARPDG